MKQTHNTHTHKENVVLVLRCLFLFLCLIVCKDLKTNVEVGNFFFLLKIKINGVEFTSVKLKVRELLSFNYI
jgi:hypothetical protein